MELKINGQITSLRSVSIIDSEFIASLRSDPRVYEYLSSNEAVTNEKQLAWLEEFIKNKKDYYFVIENLKTLKKTGTISVYNLNREKGEAEFGRFIAVDSISAIESEWLILKFVFEVLSLDSLYCRTADLNTKVWKQHYSFGFEDDGYENLVSKNLQLKRQIITRVRYEKFNYSKIKSLIERFSRS